jgi:hypothetical protein
MPATRYKSSGHQRAISTGEKGSLTVTHGQPASQVRPRRGPDCTDSQPDSAGSILPARGIPYLAPEIQLFYKASNGAAQRRD